MIGNKTLIAYTTQGGATEKTAQKIAEVLKAKYELEADLVNLRKQSAPSLESYRNVIVASGVQQGEIYDETLNFLTKTSATGSLHTSLVPRSFTPRPTRKQYLCTLQAYWRIIPSLNR
jgi:menaquinone-dependent protoporphyrinogen IX oxidase